MRYMVSSRLGYHFQKKCLSLNNWEISRVNGFFKHLELFSGTVGLIDCGGKDIAVALKVNIVKSTD